MQYEAKNSPIKYQTAIALAKELGIDYRILLNEYTAFLDYPFERFLKETRVTLKLTQTEIAQKIGVTFSTYAKWESRTRIPRRREYRKITAAFKGLGIKKNFLEK